MSLERRRRRDRSGASAGVEAWERGEEAPTVGQLRQLAAKYHFPLAVFYLPEPPADFAPLRDFRRLPDIDDEEISPNLAFQIRSAYERRELALELYEDLRGQPVEFPLKVTVRDDPEKVGQAIRDFLGVDDESQKKAARQDRAFDFWRRKMEERDVLVFVVSGPHHSVELRQMRGFAIAKLQFPVVVINGRDYSNGGKPTGSAARPNIPDVCGALGMTSMCLLDLIRAEKWS